VGRYTQEPAKRASAHLNNGINIMNLAAALLLGHLIADFPLQTTWVYQYKTESWIGVLLHSAIHVIVTACLVQPLYQVIPLLVPLGILHFITDFAKVHLSTKHQAPSFIIDQLVHMIVLYLLSQVWQDTLSSTLPTMVLIPLLLYVGFLGLLVFLWVLACDLADSEWGRYPIVQWARRNLLHLTGYAGLSLFFYLAHEWSHGPQRSPSS